MQSYIYDGQVTHYQISEDGKLFNTKTGKYPKGYINKMGYLVYYFSFNGVKRELYAHRMVAQTFIPNPENKECVNHKDGNKLNNNINNLEWVTKAENNRHARDTGLNPLYKKVYCYDKNKNLIAIYDSLRSASQLTGFSENTIANCASAKNKTLACGYYWNYVEDNSFETYVAKNSQKKPVSKYSMDNIFLESYESLTQAGQMNHLPAVRISDCAHGKIQSYAGYIWKFD